MIDVRQCQFEAALDMLGNQVAGGFGIAFFESLKNRSVNLVCFFEQLAIMAEPFNTKDS